MQPVRREPHGTAAKTDSWLLNTSGRRASLLTHTHTHTHTLNVRLDAPQWFASARNVRAAAQAIAGEPAAAAFVPLMVSQVCLRVSPQRLEDEGDDDGGLDLDLLASDPVEVVSVSFAHLRRSKVVAAVAVMGVFMVRRPLRALLPVRPWVLYSSLMSIPTTYTPTVASSYAR